MTIISKSPEQGKEQVKKILQKKELFAFKAHQNIGRRKI